MRRAWVITGLVLFGLVLPTAAAAQERGGVLVEAGVVGSVAIFDTSGALVAELEKSGESPLELGLDPGRYVVMVRLGAEIWQMEVDVTGDGHLASVTRAMLAPLVARASKPKPERRREPCEGFELDWRSWDFGISLGGGVTTSALPEFDDLSLSTVGVELRWSHIVSQVRLRFAHSDEDHHDGHKGGAPWDDGPGEALWGLDGGLLGQWGWSWLGLRAGVRGGVDIAAQNLQPAEGGPLEEHLYLIVRGGMVGQAVLRPWSWLGIYGEVAGDIFVDGTRVGSAQGGVTFYF